MIPIYEFQNIKPVIHPNAYVHPTASIIGDVWIEEDCYIGPFASIRGDFNRIIIKKGANIQDSCTIHGYPEQDCIIEEYSHVGHGAIVHTAILRKNSLIGMQALIMDFAEVGENAIVAAQSFVPTGFIVPPNTLVKGSPCKVAKELSPEMLKNKKQGTELYIELAKKSNQSLKQTTPLSQANPTRPRAIWQTITPLIPNQKPTTNN